MVARIKLETQGSFVKVSYTSPASLGAEQRRDVPKRGAIKEFSARSRKRLLDSFARLDGQAVTASRPKFMTLTYGQLYPSALESKRHVEAFERRLLRRFPMASAYWRVEKQTRGAPHYHLIIFNMPHVLHEDLRHWWGEIIGLKYWDWKTANYAYRDPDGGWFLSKFCSPPRVEIQSAKSTRHAFGYVSKTLAYVAKSSDEATRTDAPAGFHEDASFSEEFSDALDTLAHYFIYVPYSSAWSASIIFFLLKKRHDAVYMGRHWGVWNRKNLPLAVLQVIEVDGTPSMDKAFFSFRRYMTHYWKKANKYGRFRGASIYAWEKSHCWYELFLAILQGIA